MNLADIAHSLHGRKASSGWVARCPAHNDHHPSLSLTETQNGRVLVKCHAGCAQTAVISALRARGLWPGGEQRDSSSDWGDLVATYDYLDERGALAYQVCRFEKWTPQGREKKFPPRRPDGRGGWRWGHGDRWLLYRLPELLENPIVFVPEGEKDVESLRSFGFSATTNPGGADGWRPEFNQYFSGRDVIILPDNDPPGWTRALTIARGLLSFAATVRILELKGAKDVSEWFEQGHSELELIVRLDDIHDP